MELYLPRTWNVGHRISNKLSSVEEKGVKELAPDAPKLLISGDLNLSALTIYYV